MGSIYGTTPYRHTSVKHRASTYNNAMVPKRWLYPQSEYDYNKANVDAAVQSQYAGNDDVNSVMWLLE